MHQTVPVTFSHVGLLDHYRIQYSSFPRVISVRCIFIMDALIFVITIRIESFCYLYYHDLYLYVLCQKRLYLPIRASIPCCVLLGRLLFSVSECIDADGAANHDGLLFSPDGRRSRRLLPASCARWSSSLRYIFNKCRFEHWATQMKVVPQKYIKYIILHHSMLAVYTLQQSWGTSFTM